MYYIHILLYNVVILALPIPPLYLTFQFFSKGPWGLQGPKIYSRCLSSTAFVQVPKPTLLGNVCCNTDPWFFLVLPLYLCRPLYGSFALVYVQKNPVQSGVLVTHGTFPPSWFLCYGLCHLESLGGPPGALKEPPPRAIHTSTDSTHFSSFRKCTKICSHFACSLTTHNFGLSILPFAKAQASLNRSLFLVVLASTWLL